MHSHYAHPSFKQVQNKCKKKNKATHPLQIRSTELGCEELPQSPFKHCLLPGLVIFWVTCISTSLLCNLCFSMHYSQIYCPITNNTEMGQWKHRHIVTGPVWTQRHTGKFVMVLVPETSRQAGNTGDIQLAGNPVKQAETLQQARWLGREKRSES